MIDDYEKFVMEPYDFCDNEFCDMYGLKFYKIFVSPTYITLLSDCNFCGSEKKEKIARKDMTHYTKLFLQKNDLGTQFRRFRLGLNYESLIEYGHQQEYKKFFFEMLNKLRKTVLIQPDGKKIMRPNLGRNLEEYLTNDKKI